MVHKCPGEEKDERIGERGVAKNIAPKHSHVREKDKTHGGGRSGPRLSVLTPRYTFNVCTFFLSLDTYTTHMRGKCHSEARDRASVSCFRLRAAETKTGNPRSGSGRASKRAPLDIRVTYTTTPVAILNPDFYDPQRRSLAGLLADV